jgi:hypothetical protein
MGEAYQDEHAQGRFFVVNGEHDCVSGLSGSIEICQAAVKDDAPRVFCKAFERQKDAACSPAAACQRYCKFPRS